MKTKSKKQNFEAVKEKKKITNQGTIVILKGDCLKPLKSFKF
jgi:hypothetical protein